MTTNTRPDVPDAFEWWPAEVLDEIVRRRGLHKGKCRLERRQGPVTAKGQGGGLLRVVGEDGKATRELNGTECPDLNESRWCPPICP